MTTVSAPVTAGVKAGTPLRMYRQMIAIRLFEDRVNDLYTRALMPGLAHLYIGEEGVAVGICETLRADDYITSTHRGHGHCLAKGAAFASKALGQDRVAVCFFGEGALGQGVLYESMNLAQLWRLPVIYACENNLYNEYTHCSETTAGDMLARPAAFGLAAEAVDGQDVRAVHAAATRMVERARRGDGPGFLLLNTYRFRGHHVGDIAREYYRPKVEEQRWMSERDPVALLAASLVSEGLADQAMLDRIQGEVAAEMDAAVEFALNAPYPDPREVDEDVYA